MRVASFLLPVRHARGERYDPAHQEVRGALVREFGGYTASECMGAWKAPSGQVINDQNIRYEVAADYSVPGAFKHFRDIAEKAGWAAGQQSVMLVDDTGEVHFIDME
jgi:hypothetical protein